MIETRSKSLYKAFGLTIASPFSLPELPLILEEQVEEPDVVIKIENLTNLWMKVKDSNFHFISKEEFVMFSVAESAIYLIRNGNEILVHPIDESKMDVIRLYVLGTCMGVLLMQRKIVPLHGSAVAIQGKAYAIIGNSGAGKSTLASAFLNQGCRLLADDIIPVTICGESFPVVSPAYPQQKLWQESIESLGIAANGFKPIYGKETKFRIPVESQFVSSPLPLRGIIELVKTGEKEIKIQEIQKLQRIHTIFEHTYRKFLIDRLDLTKWHFQISAKIANKTVMHQLQRPISTFTANELPEVIIKAINKGSENNDQA